MVVQYLGCIAIEFQIANNSPDEGNLDLDLDNLDITTDRQSLHILFTLESRPFISVCPTVCGAWPMVCGSPPMLLLRSETR